MKKLFLLIFIVLLFPSTSFCGGFTSYDFFGPTSCHFVTDPLFSRDRIAQEEFLPKCINDLIRGIEETREKTSEDSKLLPLRIDTLQESQHFLEDKLKDAELEIESLTRRINMLGDEVRFLKQKEMRKNK